ncbi:MAG TPA: hypothetical protein VGM51_10155 [Armatimonadota bacterium]|jgi:hypothetical protein
MSVKRPASTDRRPRRSRSAADIANDVLALIARLAALVFIASLAYMAYAAYGGPLSQYPNTFDPALSKQLTHNVQVASQAMLISGVVGSLSLVALLWGWDWGWILFAIAGGLLYAALPYFAVPFLSEASRSMVRQNHPGADILAAWRTTGLALLSAGGLLLAGWIGERLQDSLAAPRRAGSRLKVPFYSSCWQTHYCKDEINKLCMPGRNGYHKSCWRYKSGCICDESIADKVFAEARQKMGKDAAKWLGAPGKAPAPTLADRFKSTYHKAPYQKVACADCPIYNFHEVQKHKILAPLTLVGVPALMLYEADALHAWYARAMASIDKVTLRLAFDPAHTSIVRSQIRGALDIPLMEWVTFGLAALALITLAARILEYWCFEAKL